MERTHRRYVWLYLRAALFFAGLNVAFGIYLLTLGATAGDGSSSGWACLPC